MCQIEQRVTRACETERRAQAIAAIADRVKTWRTKLQLGQGSREEARPLCPPRAFYRLTESEQQVKGGRGLVGLIGEVGPLFLTAQRMRRGNRGRALRRAHNGIDRAGCEECHDRSPNVLKNLFHAKPSFCSRFSFRPKRALPVAGEHQTCFLI